MINVKSRASETCGAQKSVYTFRMNRRFRALASIAAAAALLFSQLAIANFACPGHGDMAAAVEQTQVAGGGQDVDHNLCQQHCQYGKASVDATKPTPSVSVTIGAALRVPTLESLSPAGQPAASGHWTAPSPPPLSRFTVLRI